MKMSRIVLGVAAASLMAAGAGAADPPLVGRVFFSAPKPGMTGQFEAGRKKHMEFHKAQKDSWAWWTWQIETGPRTGGYISGTFGHSWKDFDDWEKKLGVADAKDAAVNLGPNLAGGENGFYLLHAEISRPAAETTPGPMIEVIHFRVKPEREMDFVHAITSIHEAIGKTSWPVHYEWHELLNGGEGPSWVLVMPRKGYADMAGPETPFPAMVEKGLGADGAKAVLGTLNGALKGTMSEILTYRADLSYGPTP